MRNIIKPSNSNGFSLIELMVVVAIIGIIAAIALPGYADYVRRGKAAEATSTLADLKNRMEQYYQDNRTYLDVGGLTAPCTPPAGTTRFFTYVCALRTADTYTLAATGVAEQDMANFVFSINENNLKTSTFDGNVCNTRWLTSKTSTC